MEIKPCPFCGAEAHAIKDENPHLYRPARNGWHVVCPSCDLLFGYDTDYSGIWREKEDAITAWNKRVNEKL